MYIIILSLHLILILVLVGSISFLRIKQRRGKEDSDYMVLSTQLLYFLSISLLFFVISGCSLFTFEGLDKLQKVYILLIAQGHILITSICYVVAPKSNLWRDDKRVFKGLLLCNLIFTSIVCALYWVGVDLMRLKSLLYILVVLSTSVIMAFDITRGRSKSDWLYIVSQPRVLLSILYFILSHIVFAVEYMIVDIGPLSLAVVVSTVVLLMVSIVVLVNVKKPDPHVGGYGTNYKTSIDNYHLLKDEMEDCEQKAVAGRLISLFNNDKPFLNPSLTICEVASMLYTNRSYLSRLLNNHIGLNFNEFVNSYRIDYAMNLFFEDATIDLKEMCRRSGFRNQSSFNSAFKQYTGITPGDWCRRLKKGGGNGAAKLYKKG